MLNAIQKDFPLSATPYADLAATLAISEEVLLDKMKEFTDSGHLTRVGPFYNMDKSTGHVSLIAMIVPIERFLEVTDVVNSFVEVAHNYQRQHQFNMWFVLAAKNTSEAESVLQKIEELTQLKTYRFPKEREFTLDLFLEVK